MNDDQNRRLESDPVHAILAYLASHPHAADSAEGVARWWLGPGGSAFALSDVESALNQLVARQALRQESLSDGTTLYSKNGKHEPKP